ncbi:MAG: ShlB/FhaC/HecB family hemolysin secretion/activation protein [Synechococcaceae cyanobacterium]|nr:ShlB/FhaC/HecB family hemolysin secretion/activation protein [Synechococcaceae cyanobacterium]
MTPQGLRRSHASARHDGLARSVVLAGVLVSGAPAWCQSGMPGLPTPSLPAPMRPPRLIRPIQPKPSPLQDSPGTSIPRVPGAAPAATRLKVSGFRLVGNTVFSNQELLAAIAKSYDQKKIDLSQPLSFSDLNEARQAITQFYIDKGYTTSGAYIPTQTIADGVVEIRILEGRLGDLTVDVKKGRLRPGYVRSRILRASGGVLNLNRLVDELRLLQVNPLISKINANLSASSTPGRSNLQVAVVSAPTLDAAIAMDNGRNPQIGSFRRGVDLGDANVFGHGDSFTLNYRNSDGSNDLLMSYKIPLNSSDLALTLTNRHFNSWIIEEPLSLLNIRSQYQQWFVGLRQPLIRRVEEEFSLGLSLNKQDNKGLYLDGLPYPGRGVDPNGESRVTTLSFSQDWTKRSTTQVFSMRSELGLGLDAFDSTTPADYPADPNSPDANFLFWRADAQYVRQLATNTLLVARGRAQLADGPLPTVEQFGLGGLGSVEGYQTNSVLTDNGVFASLELAVPLANWQKGQSTLQLVPFTSIGYGWNAGTAPVNTPRIDLLSSVGLGLQLRMGNNFYGRLDYAQRLGPTPYQATNFWQDQAVLFTVRYGL